MILRFKIRNPLLVIGPRREGGEGQTTFTYKRLQCSIGLIGMFPLDNSRENYFDLMEYLEFTIREDPRKNIIQSLIDTQAYERLVTIMRTIVNRCLRAIRNFGRVYGVHELPRVEDEEAKELLGLWHAEVSLDSLNWMPIVQESKFSGLGGGRLFGVARTGITTEDIKLDMQRWVEIEKAIQDNLSPLPEQEFIVNASEHLYLRNFRLALVESVIGLEIVLSRYLSTYLLLLWSERLFIRRDTDPVIPEFVHLFLLGVVCSEFVYLEVPHPNVPCARIKHEHDMLSWVIHERIAAVLAHLPEQKQHHDDREHATHCQQFATHLPLPFNVSGREMSGTPRGVGAPVARRDEHGAQQSGVRAERRFPLH